MSSAADQPVIRACFYVPPDVHRKAESLRHFGEFLSLLKQRYRSFNLIAFVDFNMDLRNFSGQRGALAKCIADIIQDYNLSVVYDTNAGFTRLGSESYLDFFLTHGVRLASCKVEPHFGLSDHLLIKGSFSGFFPVLRKTLLRYSRNLAVKALTSILKEYEDGNKAFSHATALFSDLSIKLRSAAIRKAPKPISYFEAARIVDQELSKEHPNRKLIFRTLSTCKRDSYLNLMFYLTQLKKGNKLKEYFSVIGHLLIQK